MSLTLAAVVVSVCTRPESLSTPMCAFMPKCHWLPFLAWCISGSRACSLFFVELGAPIKVASTSVPWVIKCVFHAIVTVDFRGVTGHFKNIVTGDFRNCVTGFVKIFEMDAMI